MTKRFILSLAEAYNFEVKCLAFERNNFQIWINFVDPFIPIISTSESESPVWYSLQTPRATFRDESPRRSGVGHHWPRFVWKLLHSKLFARYAPWDLKAPQSSKQYSYWSSMMMREYILFRIFPGYNTWVHHFEIKRKLPNQVSVQAWDASTYFFKAQQGCAVDYI